jgi:UDP-apiose/xylose synthase
MDYVPGVDGKDDGQPRVLASFMTALMKGEPLVLVDGGEVYRTFCFVDDAVESVVRMIDRPEKSIGHAFNVGNPQNNIQIKELAALMIDLYSGLTGKPLGTTRDVAGVDYYGKGYPLLSHLPASPRIPPYLPASRIRGLPPFLIPGSACKCSPRRHHVPTGTKIPTFGSLRCVSSSRSSTGSRRRA